MTGHAYLLLVFLLFWPAISQPQNKNFSTFLSGTPWFQHPDRGEERLAFGQKGGTIAALKELAVKGAVFVQKLAGQLQGPAAEGERLLMIRILAASGGWGHVAQKHMKTRPSVAQQGHQFRREDIITEPVDFGTDAAYELLLAHPTLIQRPIVTTDARPDELQIGFQEDELHAFLRLP